MRLLKPAENGAAQAGQTASKVANNQELAKKATPLAAVAYNICSVPRTAYFSVIAQNEEVAAPLL